VSATLASQPTRLSERLLPAIETALSSSTSQAGHPEVLDHSTTRGERDDQSPLPNTPTTVPTLDFESSAFDLTRRLVGVAYGTTIQTATVDIYYNVACLNPWGGIERGFARWEPDQQIISFFDYSRHRVLTIRLRSIYDISEVSPRQLPTWISTAPHDITANCAKLVRDVCPEAYGLSLSFRTPTIHKADYYATSLEYVTGRD
jgi:hypothetical protein